MATLRQFEYFIRVVDTNSFTVAADELAVTQPGLSHQLKALEASLGGALLERLSRGVRLTPLGLAVLPHARAAVADAQRAVQASELVRGMRGGAIEVATVTSLGLGPLPGVLRAWRRRHPDVIIRLEEHHHVDTLIEVMLAGAGHVAISPAPAQWSGPRTLLGVEEFSIVVPVEHPMAVARRRNARLEDFAAEAWVHFAVGHGLGGVLDHHASLAGFTPLIAMRTGQTAAAPLYAAAGMGPTLVPTNMIPSGFTGYLLRPQPAIRREVYAFTRQPPGPLVAAFIATAAANIVLSGPSTPRS